MRLRRAFTAALALSTAVLVGCAGGMRCEDPDRYAGAQSIPELRVPGDIGLPDEGNALRIPPAPQSEPERIPRRGPCLEHPPYYNPDLVDERPIQG